MTRMIRRFLCLALAAVMMAALLPFAVSGTTAKAASSTGIVTLEGVNFRVGPSMKDKVLFKISKGTVCPVLSKVTANGYDWYEVTGKDPEFGREYTGYIRGDCFRMLSEGESGNNGNSSAVVTAKPANSSATANNLPAPANAVGTINNWGVNFRSAPWGNVLASLDKGTQVTVLTVPQTVSRQNWYQVQYNGQQGYIMATYLDYSGKTAKPTATPAPGAATPTPAPGGTTPTAAPVVNPDNNGEILGYVMTIKGSVNIRASIGGTSLTQVGIYETFPYLLTPVRRQGLHPRRLREGYQQSRQRLHNRHHRGSREQQCRHGSPRQQQRCYGCPRQQYGYPYRICFHHDGRRERTQGRLG